MGIYRGGVVPGQGSTPRGNADEIDIEDSGNIIDSTNVEDALQELATELDTEEAALAAHIADTTDAHDASAISNVAAGNIVATTVQAAIDELDGQDTAHLDDTTDAHDASAISYDNTTSGLIATAIQAALDEYDPILKHSSGNGIYNGKMTVNQYGLLPVTGIVNNTVYIDRWKSQISTVTADLSLETATDTLKLEATSTATGHMGQRQWVEDYDKYAGETITYSFKYRTNKSTDARLLVWDGAAYILATDLPQVADITDFSVTFDMSSTPSALMFSIGIQSTTGGTKSITSGDYIEFTDVRLDLGSHRLSGDREYGEELALCQRYYYEIAGQSARICTAAYFNTTTAYGHIQFPVTMRIAPTVGVSAGTDGQVFAGGGAPVTSAITGVAREDSAEMAFTTAATTAGWAAFVRLIASGSPKITFTAEL